MSASAFYESYSESFQAEPDTGCPGLSGGPPGAGAPGPPAGGLAGAWTRAVAFGPPLCATGLLQAAGTGAHGGRCCHTLKTAYT